MTSIETYILTKLNLRKQNNSFRTFKINEGLVDFCSNDYLGFARSLDLAQRIDIETKKLQNNVNGSTGARTITGTNDQIVALENQLAAFHKMDSALLFTSGYNANLGLFSSLPYRGDTILYDELIHASIRDGIRLSKANAFSFAHNDVHDLEKKLQRNEGRIYVSVESVYSMDGDMAPLLEIASLCKKYNAALIVDEAHSNALFGPNGEGLVVELGLEKEVFANVVTFGKAIGCHGAAILGSQNLKDFLINYSRPFIYTTAPSPHAVLSVKCAYDMLSDIMFKIKKIKELINLFKQELEYSNAITLIPSNSPIQCIILPGNERVKQVCGTIQMNGFDVRPILAPTVAEGKERIRICLHAFNTEDEVKQLCNALNNAINT